MGLRYPRVQVLGSARRPEGVQDAGHRDLLTRFCTRRGAVAAALLVRALLAGLGVRRIVS
jgi:hypothetical protein